MSAPAHSGEAKVDSREPPPALVARVVRGDAEASRALWDHYAPPVRRFVQRMMGPSFDPSDLVQEIFLGVFSGLGRLRQQEALRSFVFAVAINQVRIELRRRRLRTLFGGRPKDEEACEVEPGDPDSLVSARRLYQALDRLPVRDRELVVLRFLEGLTLLEVAAHAGCSCHGEAAPPPRDRGAGGAGRRGSLPARLPDRHPRWSWLSTTNHAFTMTRARPARCERCSHGRDRMSTTR